MVSWAAVLALSGFRYSAIGRKMTFAAANGTWFWSNGSAWGTCRLKDSSRHLMRVQLTVLHGELILHRFAVEAFGEHEFRKTKTLKAAKTIKLTVARD